MMYTSTSLDAWLRGGVDEAGSSVLGTETASVQMSSNYNYDIYGNSAIGNLSITTDYLYSGIRSFGSPPVK